MTEGSAAPREYPRSHVLAAFAAVYVVWGSTYLAIRYAVESIPPLMMGGTRFLVSGAILYVWARARGTPSPNRKEWRDATIAGVLMLCFGNGAVSWAEQHLPSGLVALLVAVVPLWMVLVDWARPSGVRPRVMVLLGVGVGFVGLMMLVGGGAGSAHSASLTAAVVLVGASLAWAVGSVFNRYSTRPASAAMATGSQMLGGGLGLLLAGVLGGEMSRLHISQITPASWLGWAYLVTFGSLVGFTAYIYLLGAVSPAKASTYAYVNPIVAVFLGWAVAGEVVSSTTLTAAAVTLSGVAMITLAPRS
jgi:drug/metabolite transporter (DMT)-like permease